jgi:hypothetical protein
MSQFGYYLIIIAISVLNVGLAAVAYWQRDKQIKGNRLREHQVRLAEARNELAELRLSYLERQTKLLTDIRKVLRERPENESSDAPKTTGRGIA